MNQTTHERGTCMQVFILSSTHGSKGHLGPRNNISEELVVIKVEIKGKKSKMVNWYPWGPTCERCRGSESLQLPLKYHCIVSRTLWVPQASHPKVPHNACGSFLIRITWEVAGLGGLSDSSVSLNGENKSPCERSPPCYKRLRSDQRKEETALSQILRIYSW